MNNIFFILLEIVFIIFFLVVLAINYGAVAFIWGLLIAANSVMVVVNAFREDDK